MNIKNYALTKCFWGILLLVAVQIVLQLFSSALVLFLPAYLSTIISAFLAVALIFYLVQLSYRYIFKEEISPFISRIHIQGKWLAVSLLLPLGVTSCFLLLPGSWSWHHFSGKQLAELLTSSIFYYGLATGIMEELVFRGIMMTELKKRYGSVLAIWAPSIVFASLHVIGRQLSWLSILLLLVAGTAVGVMFSLITLESRSVWNSALVHGVWNSIIIGGIIHIGTKNDAQAWFNYLLHTKNLLLTGGDFGIEASFIAILGYLAVSLLALSSLKKRGERLLFH